MLFDSESQHISYPYKEIQLSVHKRVQSFVHKSQLTPYGIVVAIVVVVLLLLFLLLLWLHLLPLFLIFIITFKLPMFHLIS